MVRYGKVNVGEKLMWCGGLESWRELESRRVMCRARNGVKNSPKTSRVAYIDLLIGRGNEQTNKVPIHPPSQEIKNRKGLDK